MKKVLSFILGTVFSFFSVGNLNLTHATDGVESSKTQVSETTDRVKFRKVKDSETTDGVESREAQARETINSVESREEQTGKTIITNKKTVEKTSHSNSKYYNGIKNVINHPFQIMFRAGGWAILGALTGLVLPINAVITSVIGLACGAASKAMDLYENGYNKD